MSRVRLSILIPVYNEADSIKAVLEHVVTASAAYFQSEEIALDLIVVDDGSHDASCVEVETFAATHPGVSLQLIRQQVNSGKGSAVRTAIEQSQGDFCLIQDADFEYDPQDYPKLLEPLLSGEADVVLGSRFMNAQVRRPLKFWQAAANRAITAATGMACGLELSDVETGYKAFRTSLGKTIPLKSKRFGLEPELVIQFARRHARFMEVPISYRGRTQEQGKKIGLSDACSAFGTIVRTRWFSAAHTDAAADMLVAISGAKRFNQWMADTISPWIVGEVLEFGAGIGNLTVPLSAGRPLYTATDTDPDHLSELRSRTAYRPNVNIGLCDFLNLADVTAYRKSADTVICLNVLEHVADDIAGLGNIHACLRPGGTAIILVPQGPEAFGSLDEVLDHKRRYTRLELQSKLTTSGFTVKRILEFNHATFPGWYLNSRILRRRTLSRFQLQIFDWLVPLWRQIDNSLPWPPTSLIAIATTNPHAAR